MNSPGRKSLLIGPGRLNLVHVEPDGLMYNSAFVISDGETKRALILFVSWRMVAVIGVTKSWLGSSRPGKTRRMVSVSSCTTPAVVILVSRWMTRGIGAVLCVVSGACG